MLRKRIKTFETSLQGWLFFDVMRGCKNRNKYVKNKSRARALIVLILVLSEKAKKLKIFKTSYARL